jgi:hypothetical protein
MINSFKKADLSGKAHPSFLSMLGIFVDKLDGNVNGSQGMTSKIDC